MNLSQKMTKAVLPLAMGCAFALASTALSAATLYFNGFETNTAGWSNSPVRVATGSNGIPSSDGAFHATTAGSGGGGASTFTQWGGYNFGAGSVPTVFQEYWTSVDIYLNVGGGWANDTRFDFDSAISNAAGGFLRDFVFNAGFYNDATGPGANTNRFVISASNNSQPGSAFAKNPARGPIAISTTGWYTFEHHFYNDGGFLAVDMSISDATDSLVNSWTLGNSTDPIALVGGNRYGWFDWNQLSPLAFDNSELRLADAAVPLPGTLALMGLGLAGLGWKRRKQS